MNYKKAKYIKEEVMQILTQLRIGQRITIGYYGTYEKEYLTHTGKVSKINNYWQNLTLGEVTFDFSEIDVITIH